ncbi:tripartite tricarboxylate transporter TctB family protein [Conservatibacter flavescens]|uniref:Tripartite tricarboxylate transporter TctB family protein n=1 Tax=Conservatibacter flavescens TaxID=28161 RepID=A0A2M8RZM4_9PAST|nr:tripartite tricarboxylate transporter TctB family protein [Conservatibacter flavescens]PJG84314.1 tripartite tricarboxylate transporter TctB family protein [Conservatibacter flavescens]
MVKNNIFIGFLSVLFGILILYFSQNMNMFDEYNIPGERFWPFCLAILFIFLGICQWIETIIHRHKKHSINLTSPAVKRAYVLFLIMIFYGIGLIYIGFIVSSLLLIPIIMKMMGEKKPYTFILAAFGIVFCIYLFFEVIFNSPLPSALLFE